MIGSVRVRPERERVSARRARAEARPTLLTPMFLTVAAAELAYFTADGVLLPALPRYVTGPLGSGNVAVGLVMGAFSLSAFFLRPWAGGIADRRGRRILMVTGGSVFALSVVGYLIASSVLGILAQRLVRIVCRECREPSPVEGEIRREVAADGGQVEAYRGRGCDACNYTGYRGRTGIYEFLIVDEEIRRLSLQKTSAQVIKQAAVGMEMRTLREDGWAKVRRGITSVSEVLRVTQEETELEGPVPHEEVSRPIPLTSGIASRAGEA